MVGYSFVNLTGFSEDRFLAAAPDLEAEARARAQASDGQVDVEGEATGQFNNMLAASQVSVAGSGISGGLGAQLKFWVFVLGARYAYTHTSDFGMHAMGADLGLRIGDTVALYGRGGLGYALLGGLPDELNAQGYYAEIAGGLDFRLGKAISIGFGADADVLFLGSTGQLGAALGGSIDADTASEIDGSAVGFLLRPQLHLTWHL